jgi:hypothetical protein
MGARLVGVALAGVGAQGCSRAPLWAPLPPIGSETKAGLLIRWADGRARVDALDLDPPPTVLERPVDDVEADAARITLELLTYTRSLETMRLLSGPLEIEDGGAPLPSPAAVFATSVGAGAPWTPAAEPSADVAALRLRVAGGSGCPRVRVRSVELPDRVSALYAIPLPLGDDGVLIGDERATYVLEGDAFTRVGRAPAEFAPTAGTTGPADGLHFGDAEGRIWTATYVARALTATLALSLRAPSPVRALDVSLDAGRIDAFTIGPDGRFARVRGSNVQLLRELRPYEQRAPFAAVRRRRSSEGVAIIASENGVFASVDGQPARAEPIEDDRSPSGFTSLGYLSATNRELVGTKLGDVLTYEGLTWRRWLPDSGFAVPVTAFGEIGDRDDDTLHGAWMSGAAGVTALWTEERGLCPLIARVECVPRFIVRRANDWVFAGETLGVGATKISIVELEP